MHVCNLNTVNADQDLKLYGEFIIMFSVSKFLDIV